MAELMPSAGGFCTQIAGIIAIDRCRWTFWCEILDCVFSMAWRDAETSAWTFNLRLSLPLDI
jgi:hypothetical protein